MNKKENQNKIWEFLLRATDSSNAQEFWSLIALLIAVWGSIIAALLITNAVAKG